GSRRTISPTASSRSSTGSRWSGSSPTRPTSILRRRSRSSSGTTTPPSRRADLGALRQQADVAGVVLDFDGTLAEIVARPEHARPVDGARDALVELAGRYRTVAIVTGRRSEEVVALLDVPHVTYVGLYGLEDDANELVTAIVPAVETATAGIPEAWVEDKGVSVAV